MNDPIKWDTTPKDTLLISKIAKRYHALVKSRGWRRKCSIMDTEMDLVATHRNGCPLDLNGLLNTDDFTLIHDVSGIARYLDRDTGKLTRYFLPRLAIREVKGANERRG